MLKSIEATGRNEEEAISNALTQLGLDRDDISVEVLERAKTGFLGIGSVPARIRATYEAPDEASVDTPVLEPEPVPARRERRWGSLKRSAAERGGPSAVSEKLGETQEEKVPVPDLREISEIPDSPKPAPAPISETLEQPSAPQPVSGLSIAEQPASAQPASEQPSPDQADAEDDATDKIIQFMSGLFAHMDAQAVPVVTRREDNIYQVVLQGEHLGALIGRRGETLDAIQHLTSYVVNQGRSHRVRVHVDAENYRLRREESLQRLARKMAGKAVKYRRNMTLEPMNAYERHVIHTTLQNYPGVSTHSTGSEPNRRTVIIYDPGKQ